MRPRFPGDLGRPCRRPPPPGSPAPRLHGAAMRRSVQPHSAAAGPSARSCARTSSPGSTSPWARCSRLSSPPARSRLAAPAAPLVRGTRAATQQAIKVPDVVTGDWVELLPGDQLVADGGGRASGSLQADESLLTGESEPVDKQPGDRLLSGSFVVAGSGGYEATEVGAEAYARKLAAEARRFALVRSELVEGINQILRYVTWAIVPVAALLLVSQLHARASVPSALIGTVAAVVGMVPQGLVLLTSVAFGVAAVALSRRHVLVQQLPAVEGLARADVVCFDKTGTLTDGTIAFDHLIRLDDQAPAEAALGALADDHARNATLAAIGQAFPPPQGWARQDAVPFSSARKGSAATFAGHGTWALGAPEP